MGGCKYILSLKTQLFKANFLVQTLAFFRMRTSPARFGGHPVLNVSFRDTFQGPKPTSHKPGTDTHTTSRGTVLLIMKNMILQNVSNLKLT